MRPYTWTSEMRLLSFSFALVLLSAACARAQGDERAEFPDVEQRRARAWAASEVARTESDTLFSDVTGIDIDSRGRAYVADWFAARVLVLDENGGVVGSIGRKGLGPGEFRGIRGVQVLAGDSLLVYDPGAARLSVFPPGAAQPAYTVNMASPRRSACEGRATGRTWPCCARSSPPTPPRPATTRSAC